MSLARIILFFVCLLTINFSSSVALANSTRPFSHIVIDYNNGQTISAYRENERMYPASLTKIMTLYILFDKIKNNKISFNQKISISKKASSQEPSKLGLPAGSTILVKDAIVAIIVRSANDMAYAVAETVSSSNEKDFVKLMNQTAKKLGLNNTHFTNPTGLPNKEQYTTAYDMAILSRSLMVHFNSYYRLFSTNSYQWNGIKYNNTNHLLDYDGVDGIKTGYTRASGYNLITSAYKNDARIITVAMGLETSEQRDEYVKNIVREGLELADNNRKYLVQLTYKPNTLKNDTNKTNDDFLYVSAKEQIDNETNDDAYILTNSSEINNFNLSSTAYTITQDPDIQKIRQADYVVISPDVKRGNQFVKTLTLSYSPGNYNIQLGAFSTYQRALNVSFNALKVASLKNLLKKKNLTITEKDKLYVVQYKNFSASNANFACQTIINKKVSECFIKVSPIKTKTVVTKVNTSKKSTKKQSIKKNVF